MKKAINAFARSLFDGMSSVEKTCFMFFYFGLSMILIIFSLFVIYHTW